MKKVDGSDAFARTGHVLVILFLSCVGTLFAQDATGPRQSPKSALEQLPLRFELNAGQADGRVAFVARGRGSNVLLGRDRATLTLHKSHLESAKGIVPAADQLDMEFVGADKVVEPMGEEKLPGFANYIVGTDQAKWHTDIPTYARVRYPSLYPGVDLIFYSAHGQLEYDFTLEPHIDPSQIALRFSAAAHLALTRDGDLEIVLHGSAVNFHKPVLYQLVRDQKVFRNGCFRLLPSNTLTFQIADYDASLPLIIDPVLAYSTFVGGTGDDAANAVAVDAAGEAFIAGAAESPDFPVSSSAFQSTKHSGFGQTNAFVTKLNSSGSAILYSTYVGGSNNDEAVAIAVDASGNAFITGITGSTDFPTTPGVFQPTNHVIQQGDFTAQTTFVAKLNPTGSALVYSTYLGGSTEPDPNQSRQDHPTSLAIDAAGNAYTTGFTYSSDFPVTPGAFQTSNKGVAEKQQNAWVSKLNPTASALVYSTYFGTAFDTAGEAIAVNAAGEAFVAGSTYAPNFPTTPGVYQTPQGVNSASGFLTRFSADGSSLIFSMLLNGDVTALTLNAAGEPYIAGVSGANFPTTPNAAQGSATLSSIFITHLTSTGSALLYSTFFGSEYGPPTGIALDSLGDAFVTGSTEFADLPVTPGALQPNFNGFFDFLNGYLVKLDPAGSSFLYSTYFGGTGYLADSGGDFSNGIAVDGAGNVYIAGSAASPDLLTTPGVFLEKEPRQPAGDKTAFVTKFNASELRSLSLTTLNLTDNANLVQDELGFTATVTANSGGGQPTGLVRFSVPYGSIGTVPLTNGVATIPPQPLILGPQAVAAVYLGDSLFAPSSSTLDELVSGLRTATQVTVSQPSTSFGTPVTFALSVTSAPGTPVPTGSVGIDGTYVNLDAAGKSTYSSSSLPAGDSLLSVHYLGDTLHAGSSTSVKVSIAALGATPAPTFSPTPGSFSSIVQVSLNEALPGSTIYYTLDGSTPTITSAEFVVPLFFNSMTFVQAIAIAPGYLASPVSSATYTPQAAAPPVQADFQLTLASNSLVASATMPASTLLTLTPISGFDQTVTFTCSGLPSSATCSFAPLTLTPGGTESTTLTISTVKSVTAMTSGPRRLLLSFGTLALFCFSFRFSRRCRPPGLLALLLLPSALLCCACGSGSRSVSSPSPSPTPTVANVVITGTAISPGGTLQHQVNLTLQTF